MTAETDTEFVRQMRDEFEAQMHPTDLDPELEPWLVESSFGTVLKHPLLYALPYHPALNGLLNAQIAVKLKAVKQAKQRRQWPTYIGLHERAWRLQALEEIADRLRPRTYWSLLGEVYTDSENLWQNLDLWHDMLHDPRPDRVWLMTQTERRALKTLPQALKVYRGYVYGQQEQGLSWTLRPGIAHWFALRHASEDDQHGRVLEGEVERSDVLAHFTGRNEAEIVALPERVTINARYAAVPWMAHR